MEVEVGMYLTKNVMNSNKCIVVAFLSCRAELELENWQGELAQYILKFV